MINRPEEVILALIQVPTVQREVHPARLGTKESSMYARATYKQQSSVQKINEIWQLP